MCADGRVKAHECRATFAFAFNMQKSKVLNIGVMHKGITLFFPPHMVGYINITQIFFLWEHGSANFTTQIHLNLFCLKKKVATKPILAFKMK